jgi:hypothetical protein
LSKASSASAQERGYWNAMSLQSLLDTGGLGVGLGSSRASGWAIAVVSQLGVLGAVFMVSLFVLLLRGPSGLRARTDAEQDALDLATSVRALAAAGLVGACIGSGSADPGVPFFISLAVVTACRATLTKTAQYGSGQHSSGSYTHGMPAAGMPPVRA